MANDEIARLAQKAKETNKDITVKRPDGETVEVKNPTPGSTTPDSSVAQLNLSVAPIGGSLKILPTGATTPVEPSSAQIKAIADKDGWVPTKLSDYMSMMLTDRTVPIGNFRAMLMY